MKRRIDVTPYLAEGENVVMKSYAMQSKSRYVELAVNLLLTAITVVGDCFILGVLIGAKDTFKNTAWALPLLIILFAIHVTALVMWLAGVIKKLSDKSERWFVLTDKRIIIVRSGFPSGAEFIDLKDITSVKFEENKITLFAGDERLALSNPERAAEFSSALENRLDEIFEKKNSLPAENAKNENGGERTSAESSLTGENSEAEDEKENEEAEESETSAEEKE